MQSGGYGKRYRVKPRFYIIIFALIGLFIWAMIGVLGLFRPARVEWGKLSSDQSITAIVLRDEKPVDATEYSRLSCIATEGGAIKKGDPVAMLYLSGFSDKDIESLVELQNKIKDHQENDIYKNIMNKDLTDINAKIDNKMSEISAKAISRQTDALAASEQDLKTYMADRKTLLQHIVHADDSLTLMYQQEENLQSKIDQTRKVITAPSDGLLSYYLDGNETVLTVDSIAKMTPDTMKALLESILKDKQSFKSNEVVEKGQPVCRIVNASKWYALVVMSSRENHFVQGMKYDVTFGGLPKTVSTKAVKVVTQGGNTLAVLEVGEGVKDMLSLRLVGGHLGQDIEGFRVPLGMIKEDNGKVTIAIKGSGANVKRIEVSMLGRDGKYAIIEDKSGQGELAIGLPLVKP